MASSVMVLEGVGMGAKSIQNGGSSRVDHYTNPTQVQPWEWLLPTPIVPEGLSSDYDLTPISSCSQEAFDNVYKLVDDNLANLLQRESSSSLATGTIEEAISVVFDTTAPLCNDDWPSEAISRISYPDPDSSTFQGEVLSDGMKDPSETAPPAYETSSYQEDPAFAAKPLANLACVVSTEISKASDSCEFSTQLGSSPEYSNSSRKSSDQSSRKSPRPPTTTLAVLESASGVTRDSPFKRKVNHCRVERRYRMRLNTSFQNLLLALPQKVMGQSQVDSLNRPRKGNVGKGEVLELARRHIKALEERLTWLEEDRKALISGLEDLKRTLG